MLRNEVNSAGAFHFEKVVFGQVAQSSLGSLQSPCLDTTSTLSLYNLFLFLLPFKIKHMIFHCLPFLFLQFRKERRGKTTPWQYALLGYHQERKGHCGYSLVHQFAF